MDAGRSRPPDFERRIDTILLQRVGWGSIPMALSLTVLTAAAAVEHETCVAVLSGIAQAFAALLAVVVWLGRRRGAHLLDPRWAGPISMVNWLLAMAAVLAAFFVWRDVTQEIWLALLLWAFGAMQLRRLWMYLAAAVSVLSWGGAVLALGLPHVALHLITVAGAVACAALAFAANRAVLEDLEALRAVDDARREELAAALEAARRELQERRAAEEERERLREQFVAAQRMEAIGTLAGGIAHDMNNVLAGILGVAANLRYDAADGTAEDLDAIIAAAQRGASLTRSLLSFSRRAPQRRERLRLGGIVDDTLVMLRRTVPKGLTVRDQVDREIWVDGDRGHLTQALMNVCLNAVQAIAACGEGRPGHLDIAVGRSRVDAGLAKQLELEPGEYALLSVRDDGCGMEEEVRRHVFEPFFTTKPPGQGSGLGLAMVWGTLKTHGGSARAESAPGRGSTLALYLPLQPAADQASQPACGVDVHPGLRVLVVDDEPIVLKALAGALRAAGYETAHAADGVEAVERLTADRSGFEAVVLDLSMPRMNGAECFRRLRDLQPRLAIVCVSGFPLDDDTRALLGSDVAFVAKPFLPNDLIAALGRVLCAAGRVPSRPPGQLRS